MTPRKNGQKLKRSTSRPRAGSRRTKKAQSEGVHVVAEPMRAGRVVNTSEEMDFQNAPAEPNRDRAHRWTVTYPTRESLFTDTPSERRPGTLEEFHPAALEQFEEARQNAMKILDSGVVGQGECVTMISGQGNTDHKPTNGQANDGLSISIRQVGI